MLARQEVTEITKPFASGGPGRTSLKNEKVQHHHINGDAILSVVHVHSIFTNGPMYGIVVFSVAYAMTPTIW